MRGDYESTVYTYYEKQYEWCMKNNVKIGSLVEFYKPGFKEDFYLGDIGKVEDFNEEGIIVRFYKNGTLEIVSYEYIKPYPYEENVVFITEPLIKGNVNQYYYLKQMDWARENNIKVGDELVVNRYPALVEYEFYNIEKDKNFSPNDVGNICKIRGFNNRGLSVLIKYQKTTIPFFAF